MIIQYKLISSEIGILPQGSYSLLYDRIDPELPAVFMGNGFRSGLAAVND